MFTDVDRAETLFRFGCCRFRLAEVAEAVSLFAVALDFCERSRRSCDGLRARILDWRSRCYQRRREFAAAHADIERALDLVAGVDDERIVAGIYFQASVIAERGRQWVVARTYAEEALERCERLGDRENASKALNNLGGIDFLLGDYEQAVSRLKDAFRIALDCDSDVNAAYAMSSLAQVQLRHGEPAAAEPNARKALELFAGRRDHLSEIGNAQLVLGRSLLGQGRHGEASDCFAAAEDAFTLLSSTSHRAEVWMAQAELALGRGDAAAAVGRYRLAAETLQDFHF